MSLIERLEAVYSGSVADPSPEAWRALVADPAFDLGSVAVFEFAALRPEPGAKADYDRFVAALVHAVASVGGTMLGVNDTMFAGVGDLHRYEGGTSWVATFPSLRAYVDALLSPGVVATSADRRASVAEVQTVAGPNLVPEMVLQLPPQDAAAAYPSGRVQGKSPDEIVAELLQVYPDGGADPTRQALQRMTRHPGFRDQRVAYINLYRFDGDGAAALGEYNADAFPLVLAHGGRPKAGIDVEHHLVGRTAWNRLVYITWPSLAVFTDLRLDPAYLDAQRNRVGSALEYGNLVGAPRAIV